MGVTDFILFTFVNAGLVAIARRFLVCHPIQGNFHRLQLTGATK
jgi:hypothetical protein